MEEIGCTVSEMIPRLQRTGPSLFFTIYQMSLFRKLVRICEARTEERLKRWHSYNAWSARRTLREHNSKRRTARSRVLYPLRLLLRQSVLPK